MKALLSLLRSYEYHSLGELAASLFPSLRYKLTILCVSVNAAASVIELLTGMTWLAVAFFLLLMITELVSGIVASQIRKEALSSARMSRFSLKVACYVIVIVGTHVLASSYEQHDKELASTLFDWLHIFILSHITMENIISILENVAVIDGKEKTHWITKIREKFNSLLK